MDKHRDKTLDSLIGALVEITFKDNKVIKGALGYTEQFSGQYSHTKTHYYTCGNYSFRKSHVKKVRGLTMNLKSCSKCGRIHPRGYKCSAGRIYSKTSDDKLRSKYAWTKKAKQIKEDANGLCEVCKAQGVYNYDNLEVHHITKLRDDPNGLLEDDNLICLCTYHHKQADAGEISTEYLRELVKERRKADEKL